MKDLKFKPTVGGDVRINSSPELRPADKQEGLHKPLLAKPSTTRNVGLKASVEAQDPTAKAGSAKLRGDVKLSDHAFSMPPDELAALLSKEIYAAFEFAASLKDGVTAFGGARVIPGSEAFEVGKSWGESILLSNLFALSPELGLKALATGQFGQDAARGALAAAAGITVGIVGTKAFQTAVQAVGGLPDQLAAATALAQAQDKTGAERVQRAVIRSGAGPGIMEAVAIGYVDARTKLQELLPDIPKSILAELETQGSRIVLPFEQATSKYIEKLQNFVHFLPRRLALTEQAPSFLAFKGGFGTLNELFEVLRTGQPVLLEGKKFWGAMDQALKSAWKEHALVPEETLNRLILNDGAARGLPAVAAAALGAEAQPAPSMERATEMANDIVRGLATLAHVPTAVTVFGGRELKANDSSLAIGRYLAEGLAKGHTPIRLGGDGVVLDSISQAVKKADPKASVQAVLYDHGRQLDEAAIKRQADVFEVVHSAPVHKVLLYENTDGFIVHPGGVGTFDELWEIACLMQTGKIQKRPIMLVDSDPPFWGSILDEMYKSMAVGSEKTINPDDMKLFTVVKSKVTEEDKNKSYKVRDPAQALADMRLFLAEQKAEKA